ncbi:MAG: leucyl/phenylalanyl-tRNA--protein transferase [Pseudomonadota bacterium]
MPIPLLFPDDPVNSFPDIEDALVEPNGLLAAGGDLSIERLLYAYRHGIFPWYSDGEPILWWSPDPRGVLWPADLRVSRSLRKSLRLSGIEIRCDSAFSHVVRACAAPRPNSTGTWITDEMLEAYCALHQAGYARSFECWQNDELVGGLYGVAIGEVFFGESMFSTTRDASKIALVHLVQTGLYRLIDCQLPSAHLETLGARVMGRREFAAQLEKILQTGNGQ